MAYWLYQMSTEYYTHERYRQEVWEGIPVTNWTIGESKRRPTDVEPGEIVVLFFARTGADEPGIYGWGIVTYFDEDVINFRPSSPSDYLKMNPIWNDYISKVIDIIRGGMPQGTMYEIPPDQFSEIKKAIAAHVFSVR